MSARFRITFSKNGPMQYVGHLDLHRSWERTFRRSGLPLEYSQGFHPQPRLNLACALPLGFTSQCEIIDAWLEGSFSVAQVHQAIDSALPPGLAILSVENVDLHAPVLQTQVKSAVYSITFLDEVPDLDERIHRLLSAESLPRLRRNKPYDLRPLIESASIISPDDSPQPYLRVQLSTRDSATGRPDELLSELGIKFEDTHVHREKLILIDD